METSFDLDFKEVPFTVKVRNETKSYKLREFDGVSRDAYVEFIFGCSELDEASGKRRITNPKGLETALLSRCLFDGEDKPVPPDVFDKWPERVRKELFKLAQELNGVQIDPEEIKKAEAERGNE